MQSIDMNELLESILDQSTGAKFFRADLHIHSFGASHDVRDSTMTAEKIVETAIAEGLSLIAITDHNEIGNVEVAIKASRGQPLVVIPGVELSTPQGHLLLYVPTVDALKKLHGQLSIEDSGKQTSRCQQSILECLNKVKALNGFGILAHVDIQSGFEIENPGAKPAKIDVLCHPALLGIELKDAASPISYSAVDPDRDRATMGKVRIEKLSLGSKQYLARVLNSDAHTLSALGRNAANNKRVTRFKMETPSFDGLRIALEDSDARVRIEDLVPASIPKVIGLAFEGGFLKDQVIQFSPNLNCLVGGRGTGKSTAFEAVRCLAKTPSDNDGVIDSEVWPDHLTFCWEDQSGERHTLTRHKDAAVENDDDPGWGPTMFDIDCFGQGEAAKIGQEAKNNPLALLNYLDKFVEFDKAVGEEEKWREKLLELQTQIEDAEKKVALIPQYESALATAQRQLAALRKPEVKDLIDLQRSLASEKAIRTRVTEQIAAAKECIDGEGGKEAIQEILELADPSELHVGMNEFNAILVGARTCNASFDKASAQLKTDLAAFEKIVTTQMTAWKAKEVEAQKKIDAKRRELEALKVSFDMSYITKLAKDEADNQRAVTNLKTWQPHLVEKRKERAAALKERWAARAKVHGLRDAFGRKASNILKEALTDLQVTLKYVESAYSPDGSDQIIQAMGWRTNQQPRANYLVEQLTIPALITAVQKKDQNAITALRTNDDVQAFSAEDARSIIEKLSAPDVLYALERVKIYDLPRLTVSREYTDGAGQKRYLVREFSKLSLGQQQSVLLALILSSDSNRPLIIDQPEDNLDGEFIFSTLVPVLRRAKERRQVIIVTHNPNVAVLGDAEQILVLKALNERGEIVSRGSIDHVPTRDHACAILEGAKEAFLQRAKMYGVKTG